ncbi:protein phosphatase, putative [Ichthyophthirius multifiliis]|uniref:Serine/threonine-protein phosphatase n=1 Tax=Ichthyophthirius multifiliis TaxID=5932 RepID=G0QQQ2_ICHMU|nr:protein phosphatase, putative [Ichthyophthirius multifiliis]EGR32452.1 protein phosphatase, putative [Ichthyophthirius multifiliis]|eukprot:XP_004036438.1 protein phosphatase, putative [Ichthyophthirius multifiliis]
MSSNTNIDKQLEQLKKCERLKEQEVKELCNKVKQILNEEPNLVYVEAPISICGDIHGQFWDLLELFKIGGEVPQTNYLFLGDYVDRGYNSVETFLLLLALKVRYPERIILIRGNHESRLITQNYGFYDECLRKYGSINVWRSCTEAFDYLPLAAVIDNKYFCVHGGLSPGIRVLEDIQNVERRIEIPHDGIMSDMMWSDPDDVQGWAQSQRGAGYLFGQSIVNDFCKKNNIEIIFRAHQLVMDGYKAIFNDKLVTIWSAPNYCYRMGNVAAILELDENLQKQYKVFEAAPQDVKEFNSVKRDIPDYFL